MLSPTHVSDVDSLPANERHLVQLAQQGDFSAFEKLVQQLQPRVLRLAYRILGQTQDAEDVMQQTFLTVIEKIDTFRGESLFSTWVLRIATNFALKILKKKSHELILDQSSDEDSYESIPFPEFISQWKEQPSQLVENQELKAFLDKAISQLDEKYRVVFVLRDIEGLNTEETANTLGITESNVKIRLLRARLELREKLTRYLGDESKKIPLDHPHRPK